MDDVTLARALHLLAIVHWIGGVSFVTLVLLPEIMRSTQATERLTLFETMEQRFALQAKISTLAAGATGFYMTYRLDAWDRFTDPSYWWMFAMVVIWAVFTFVLFIAEPFFLHRWFEQKAQQQPESTFALVLTMHRLLLTLSLLTVGASVLGAHGLL